MLLLIDNYDSFTYNLVQYFGELGVEVQAFGGTIVRAAHIMHGKTSDIRHQGDVLFEDLPQPLTATRYHSLVVRRDDLPSCLKVTAWTDDEDNEIMGLQHESDAVFGVQFHPESILTESGHQLLQNFLDQA